MSWVVVLLIDETIEKIDTKSGKKKRLGVRSIGKHSEEGEPWRAKKIEECRVEGGTLSEKTFHEAIPSDEGAILEKNGGEAERKNRFPEEDKKWNC